MTRFGVRAKIPKTLFRIPKGKAAIERALDRTAKEAEGMFEVTFSTWKNKPEIKTQSSNARREIRVIGKIYEYVDKGTVAHIIRPRRARFLSFRGGYRAKTSPGVITSRSGGATGKRVFAKVVHHPGTQARNFSVVIAVEIMPKFEANIQEAIKDYL